MDAQATLKSNERIDRRNFDAAAFAKDNALELVGVNFFMVRISVYIALVLGEAPKGREAHSDLPCPSARTLKDAACLQHRNHISSIAISHSTSLPFFIALRGQKPCSLIKLDYASRSASSLGRLSSPRDSQLFNMVLLELA